MQGDGVVPVPLAEVVVEVRLVPCAGRFWWGQREQSRDHVSRGAASPQRGAGLVVMLPLAEPLEERHYVGRG